MKIIKPIEYNKTVKTPTDLVGFYLNIDSRFGRKSKAMDMMEPNRMLEIFNSVLPSFRNGGYTYRRLAIAIYQLKKRLGHEIKKDPAAAAMDQTEAHHGISEGQGKDGGEPKVLQPNEVAETVKIPVVV